MALSQLPDLYCPSGSRAPLPLATPLLPPVPPPPLPLASSAALLAAFEHLSAFTRCDRCNRPFSSSHSTTTTSSVVKITSDCDHLFCLECDASTLTECPVCRAPTLPRKHMVHLTQVSSMLDLVEDLRKELKTAGLLETGGGGEKGRVVEEPDVAKEKADEAFDAAIRQCAEDTSAVAADAALPAQTTASVLRSLPPMTQRREKRRLTASLSSQSAASDDPGRRRRSHRNKSRADDEVELPSPKAKAMSLRKTPTRGASASPTSTNARAPLKDVTKSHVSASKSNASAATLVCCEAQPVSTASPSPSTAQRLFSARRKREIVKAKKKEVNENGETPLHVAARRGQLDKVEELLKNGAETNTKDFAGLSPLFDACGRGFEIVVGKLLQAGAHPNTPCGKDNDTPLHESAFHGNIQIMERLIAHGANPYLENIRGETPYDLARQEVVRSYLMERIQESTTAGTIAATSPVASTTPDRSPFLGSPLRRVSSAIDRDGVKSKPAASSTLALDGIPTTTATPAEMVITTTGIGVSGDESYGELAEFAVTFGARVVDFFHDVPASGVAASNSAPPSSRVTHVVCGVDDAGNVARTVKYLLGVVGGCKMVSSAWSSTSLRLGRVQPEELFLVRGSSKNPLCEGCSFYLDGERRAFRQPDERELATMIETAGGSILRKKPAWFEEAHGNGGGIAPASVQFHAQKCRIAKNVCYYVIEEEEEEREREMEDEKGGTGMTAKSKPMERDEEGGKRGKEGRETENRKLNRKKAPLRVFRRNPHVGFASKAWLLDCFDRFEVVDAPDFEDDDDAETRADREGEARVNPLEALRERQATRVSRSRDDGTEYLMAL